MIVICLLTNINSGQVKSTKHMFSNICDTEGIQSDLYIYSTNILGTKEKRQHKTVYIFTEYILLVSSTPIHAHSS